jgi:thiaminase/transcriptional activator TenA
MESFSAQLRAEAEDIWSAIFAHPFLSELREGVLPIAKFRYYISQDYHYLEAFGRAVAIALSKAPDLATLELLSQRLLTPIERPLHVKLFGLLDLDAAAVEKVRPAPTNLAYMNHLIAVASRGGVAETTAAVLPCSWTYHDIGQRLASGAPISHPVYREWAGFYMAGWLVESVKALRGFVDAGAIEASPRQREVMRDAFLTSSRYEYLFWEMAYREERWPI